MLAAGRRKIILEKLERDGAVSIRTLSAELGVSRETIRHDLTRLGAEGLLRQVRGGAVTLEDTPLLREPPLGVRRGINAQGKAAIGRAAAALVDDGASLILDSGTTTLAVAAALRPRRDLTVITNDIRICLLLGRRNGNRMHLLGGDLRSDEDALGGWDAVAALERFAVDFAFIGAGAVSDDPALLDFSREASELRARMLIAAQTAVIVADCSKFLQRAPIRVPGLERAAALITDKAPPPAIARALAPLPLRVVIADR